MKKFIEEILKFLFFAGFVYVLLVIMVGEFLPSMFRKNMNYKIGAYGSTLSRFNEIHEFSEVDILFLGSSHAYRGFDGRVFEEFGFTSFNMGSSAQTFFQTQALLELYSEELKPKLVIIEVNPMTFSSDGVESSLDIIANVGVKWPVIKMAFKQNHLKVYNSLIFGIYYDLVHERSSEVIYSKRKGDTYIKGGYVQKDMEYYKPQEFSPKKFEPNVGQMASLENIVEMLEQRKLEVVFVQTPVTKSFYTSIENTSEFDEFIESFEYPYYNFCELMKLNDSLHFYDRHHLNQEGVEMYNKKLIEVLTEDSILELN